MQQQPEGQTFTMPLSFSKPPMSLNDRRDWRKTAQLNRLIREEVLVRARSMRLPKNANHCTVTLHYQPRDNRRRDEDNIVPTLKAACDALAAGTRKHPGYGIVKDDTPDMMTKRMPIIHPAVKGEGGKCWLTIEVEKP